MVAESKYNVITLETTLQRLLREDQGAITDYATEGYQWIYPETFSIGRFVGRCTARWMKRNGNGLRPLPNPGPFYKFRIRGDHILINPAPTTPLNTIAFEYAKLLGCAE